MYFDTMTLWHFDTLDKGLQEGIQKGRAEGKLEERYKNAKAYKENGVPVALTASTLGLSIEEVEKL